MFVSNSIFFSLAASRRVPPNETLWAPRGFVLPRFDGDGVFHPGFEINYTLKWMCAACGMIYSLGADTNKSVCSCFGHSGFRKLVHFLLLIAS